jgi:TonB family protein
MNSLKHYTLLSALCLAAQLGLAESSDPVLKAGELPAYPETARVHNMQGTVVVEALVDETGKVFAADVVQSVDKELDLAAVQAVEGWTFEPATEDGKAVMKVVQIPVQFNLVDPVKQALQSGDQAIVRK